MKDELDFAYKVHHALNENLDRLPSSAAARLSAARRIALSRKKPDAPLRVFVAQSRLAGRIGGFLEEPVAWIFRMGLALPLIACAVALIGLYQIEEQQRIEETAEIDAEVLTDELPISAYLDRGFNVYLLKRDE